MTVGELKLKLKSLEPDTRVRVRLVEPAPEAPAPYGRPKRALKPGELDKWEKKEHDRIDKLPAKERAAAKEQLAQDLAAKQADDHAMWEKKERERISQLPANERKDAEDQLAKDLAADSGAKEAGDKGGPYDIATILSVSTPNGTTVELALSLETGEAATDGDPAAAPKPTAEPV